MFSEDQICPYIKECRKYRDGDCRKVKRYKECGEYDDFKLEIYGTHEEIIKDTLENLSKVERSEKISKKKFEKCPYNLNCIFIFKIPCNNSRMHHECCDFDCEDCELNIPDLDVYCETDEYEKCESYEMISLLKEEYESMGVYSTKDLKEFFGEENYERLGGFIRCAFLEPEDIMRFCLTLLEN